MYWEKQLNTKVKTMQQIKADKDYEQAMQMVHHQNQKYIFNFLR